MKKFKVLRLICIMIYQVIEEQEELPIAKDVTEDDLKKYANSCYLCMFETERGILSGLLMGNPHAGYLLAEASIVEGTYIDKGRKFTSYERNLKYGNSIGYVDVPDDTVIAIIRISDGEMIDWGVTCFGSEDSIKIENYEDTFEKKLKELQG